MRVVLASLVEDDTVRSKFLDIFLDELDRTIHHVEVLLEGKRDTRDPSHYYANALRTLTLENLHKKQIALLRQWREETENGKHTQAATNEPEQGEQTLLSLLLSVNAIAGAIGHTG